MSFEKVFIVFETCFESVVMRGLENRQVFCFASLIQVTKSLSTPKFLKDFFYVFNPCNNFVPPLHLVDNLVFRMFNGTGAGHRMDHECNGAKYLWQFALKGL